MRDEWLEKRSIPGVSVIYHDFVWCHAVPMPRPSLARAYTVNIVYILQMLFITLYYRGQQSIALVTHKLHISERQKYLH